jgi:hypothetical protein
MCYRIHHFDCLRLGFAFQRVRFAVDGWSHTLPFSYALDLELFLKKAR